jgi:TIR domain
MRRARASGSPTPHTGFRGAGGLAPAPARPTPPEAPWEQPARILAALKQLDTRFLRTVLSDVDVDPEELGEQEPERQQLALVKLFVDRGELDVLEDAIDRARSVQFLREEGLPKPPKGKIWVFVSYSHKDEKLRNELHDLLTVLEEDGLVGAWWDGKILPGTDFDAEIRKQLDEAHVILLLVTRPFLTSKFVREVELPRAIERHDAGEARVIPIILKPAPWKDPPWCDWFGKLTVLPKDGRPVSKWKDEALSEIYSKMLATVNEMIAQGTSRGNGN